MKRTVAAAAVATAAAINPSDVYSVLIQTSAGNVHPAWAPVGAERFTQLVHDGFYTNAALFRYVPNFVVQWGLPSDPNRNTYAPIRDDLAVAGISNTVGTMSFAKSGKDTRTTQIFVNFRDNSRLDALGFTPFAVVTSGLDVLVNDVYSGYNEAPKQPKIQVEGNVYLDREFPLLTHIRAVSMMLPSQDTE
ncbi:hypothetical protein DYB32_002571 [Aphanomyces invadans]|uniref:Peptidyl-prolyl cis-trans isomerase n=1 Tax=Aphanomyces invadans TaxID=157072 RepID=A0A3R6YCQ9_9STRA|nr:hypothetical protein DYB32_002571 [Aphanomyces invadans]